MFQSFANFQPFQSTPQNQSSSGGSGAPPVGMPTVGSSQPQNTGGMLTSKLTSGMNNAALNGVEDQLGTSADMKNQIHSFLAGNGNPISQSVLAQPVAGGGMKAADPSGADGATGWFDGLLNTFASNSPSSTMAGSSALSPAAGGAAASGGDAAAGSDAAAGGGDAAASDSSLSSLFSWL